MYALARSADGSKLVSGGYNDKTAKSFSVQRGEDDQVACALEATAAGLGGNVRSLIA